MNDLNPREDGATDKAQVFVTLYVRDDVMFGDEYSSIVEARKAHGPGPGMIMRIDRNERGDFFTSIAERF